MEQTKNDHQIITIESTSVTAKVSNLNKSSFLIKKNFNDICVFYSLLNY